MKIKLDHTDQVIIGIFLLIILIMSISYARGYKAGKEVKDKIEVKQDSLI
jgi:hypothetical protein